MQNFLPSSNKIDLDSPSFQRMVDTSDQTSQSLMSPSNKTSTVVQMSTPVKKDLNNSKSPLANLRLKKSKRRECTPAYSPRQEGEEEGLKVLSLTEKKAIPKTKLNFDLPSNNLSSAPKKKFLNLIEESLNDIGDSYFGHLGSQSTPDVIYRSIFNNEEKEKESNDKVTFLISAVEDIMKEVSLKNLNVLTLMNTRVVCFESNLTCREVSHFDLCSQTVAFNWNAKNFTLTDNCLIVPATLVLNDASTPSRLVFEVKGDSVRLAVIEIYLA